MGKDKHKAGRLKVFLGKYFIIRGSKKKSLLWNYSFSVMKLRKEKGAFFPF